MFKIENEIELLKMMEAELKNKWITNKMRRLVCASDEQSVIDETYLLRSFLIIRDLVLTFMQFCIRISSTLVPICHAKIGYMASAHAHGFISRTKLKSNHFEYTEK